MRVSSDSPYCASARKIILGFDLITYEYLNKLNNLEKSDDLFDYVLFNNLILFNEEKNKFNSYNYHLQNKRFNLTLERYIF